MNLIGIDPGKKGALAWATENEADVLDTPLIGKAYDVISMAEGLESFYVAMKSKVGCRVILEKQWARPGNSAKSTSAMMEGYGIWKGILGALKIPYLEVAPQTWKKLLKLSKDKEASRAMAIKLFPYLASSLKFKKDEGRAEALLLTEYGRLILK